MTISTHRLKTKTTETFCIWYGKLCVEHNAVCSNDIFTETVHSVAASISTRLVSKDVNNVHFRQASGHYKCCSKHNLQCILEWSSRNWRQLYYSSTVKYHNHLVKKEIFERNEKALLFAYLPLNNGRERFFSHSTRESGHEWEKIYKEHS